MNAAELLEQLNTLDEHERVEGKRASEAGKSILETICAFANEPAMNGGWLLLGVARDEGDLFGGYVVEGIPDPDKVCADLSTQCRTTFNVPLQVSITSELLQGKTVLVVRVPETPSHAKPVYFTRVGLPKGALRRVGSTDQHCAEDDLPVLYQGRQSESFDSGIVIGTSFADVSPDAIADYRQSRSEANPLAEELRWTDQELLISIGCMKHVNGEMHLTAAGLVLFGSAQALRRCFPMIRVDYIRVPGREWVPDPENRFDTVEMRDSIFRLIRRAQAAIVDDLPKGFGLAEGDTQRQDKPVVPLRVIREAIVNALMHRSYRSHSPVQIIRYANRLEIRNAGFSLKAPEHLGEPGSQPRNPVIAAVLHETRFAETKGSGVRVMREIMREAGLTPPLFESDRSRDEFTARYLFHHFLGPADIAWLARFSDKGLNDDDAKALVFVKEAGAIDNATFRELTGRDTLAASQALRRLRDAGLLVQQGRGSATYYVPAAVLLPSSLSSGTDSDSLGMPDSQESGRQTASGVSEKSRRSALLVGLAADLAARVGALGSRTAPAEIRDLIVNLCKHQRWRADDLGLLLGRNTEYVRNNYLRPLLRDGFLEMTRPEEPNHPAQAYVTKSKRADA